MTGTDLQRWSRAVAEDPAAPAFVPLARMYRRQGRRPAAMNVVLRGLERDPHNVEGHALLAVLHVDVGERDRAGDEWETILRLDPENFDAHRGLGFLALEHNDLQRARRHLDSAAKVRPDDPAVRQAREVLGRRENAVAPAPGSDGGRAPAPATPPESNGTRPAAEGAADPAGESAVTEPAEEQAVEERAVEEPAVGKSAVGDEAVGDKAAGDEVEASPGAPPVSESEPGPDLSAGHPSGTPPPLAASPEAPTSRADAGVPPARAPMGVGGPDPVRLFEPLARETRFIGALLLDAQGLVLAGSVPEGRGDLLGAMLDSAVDEGRRTADILGLGRWAGIFLECDDALLHVSPFQDGIVLLVAVTTDTPIGWVVRAAARARRLAQVFMEAAQ